MSLPIYARRHYLAGVHRQLQEPPHSCRADETEEEGVPLSHAGGKVSDKVPRQVHRVVSLCTRGGGR
jgi:hypothetical protein